MRLRAARRRLEAQLARLEVTHTADATKMHRELLHALDDRTVFERLLERAEQQEAARLERGEK